MWGSSDQYRDVLSENYKVSIRELYVLAASIAPVLFSYNWICILANESNSVEKTLVESNSDVVNRLQRLSNF